LRQFISIAPKLDGLRSGDDRPGASLIGCTVGERREGRPINGNTARAGSERENQR
jgi:hypothetical protein